MTEVSQAIDAQVIVDGVTRTSSSNTISEALDGVTLTLTKSAPGTTFKLDVANDSSTLKAQLLTFISSYNTALTQMRTQSAVGAGGKASGTLVGDSAPRSIMQNLRNNVAASYGELAKLGFKTTVDGSLSLDGTKFDTAIASDPAAIDNLLGTNGTLGKSLRTAMSSYIGSGSMLGSRTESLNKKLKDLGKQRDNYEVRIEQLTAQYRTQFSALDAMVSKLQSTSNYLSQQLASLSSS
jgi:flagellar hook-associated protein 2